MKELSLHILDIVQNSIKAGANKITIRICEDICKNVLDISIDDNGCGMSKEFVERVRDPFTTTRTTRKTGMGISLFEAAAKQCGGGMNITSAVGVGTKVDVWFRHDSIDRAPIGDMASTMVTVVSGSPEIEFVYEHIYIEKSEKEQKCFLFDTQQIREILGDVPLDNAEVLAWINAYISEGVSEIKCLDS